MDASACTASSRASAQGDVGFVDVLAAMGASVVADAEGIEVRADEPLHGVTVDMSDMSDTVPTLAAVAVFAEGTTRITGVGFIRRKESDRLGALVHELRRCGVTAREEPDGLVIESSSPHGGRVETYDDHRMAMSFALLGLRVPRRRDRRSRLRGQDVSRVLRRPGDARDAVGRRVG